MANTKPTFAKLKLARNNSVKVVTFNDIEVEVKQYLPINEKLQLISNVINAASDENNFSNPIKEDLFGTLEIIYAYTNLGFTEKQKEDPAKLYDDMISSGFADAIIKEIPSEEYNAIVDGINNSFCNFEPVKARPPISFNPSLRFIENGVSILRNAVDSIFIIVEGNMIFFIFIALKPFAAIVVTV